jgi:phosphoserine phosphatase RsbU/P
VARVDSSTLRLVQLEPPPRTPVFEELPGLGELCRTFTQATGWPLRFVRDLKPGVDLLWSTPVCPEVADPPGFLRIDLGNASSLDDLRRRVPLEAAERLADSLARQLRQQWELRQTLWQREAELATAIPVIARNEEPQLLAQRLSTIVRSAAESLRCPAAALYLLDEATTQLKLRSSFGLPSERLQQPARSLSASLADLEALLGHAVVLESPVLFERWNIPEPWCQSAVVVPVSSPTLPLGTLWVFNNVARDYSNGEQNLLEIIAGRIATELEKESLIGEHLKHKHEQRASTIRDQEVIPSGPSISPMVPGYQIAGWSASSEQCNGAWHDWVMLNDGRMAMLVGDACDGGLAGALTATTLRGLFRHDALQRGATNNWRTFLESCHHTISGLSAGNHWAGMMLLVLDPTSGEIEVHSAGRPLALHISWQKTLALNPPASSQSIITNESTATGKKLILPSDLRNEAIAPLPERQSSRDQSRRERPNSNPPREAEQTPRTPIQLPIENWLKPTTPLGIGLTPEIQSSKKILLPGDLLVGVNRGMADLLDESNKPFDLARLLQVPSLDYLIRAEEILSLLQTKLTNCGYVTDGCDLSTLIVKRERR